jgi:N-acetylglucosaminyldiphosphoundecaprenol N-acetyl-beta-D-mannosaminyltransferase
MRVDATSYARATAQIIEWSKSDITRYVCAANVHMTMEAYDNPAFAQIVANADLVTPDGMPLVWALKCLVIPHEERVYGPTLVLHVCQAAAKQGIPVALYGGTPESLQAFTSFLQKKYPQIQIVCCIAPPFRPLTAEEDTLYTEELVNSKARILLVGIGCPKQEYWMAAHKSQIKGVMLGVGAAFDFHSGRVRQAPQWMQESALEWLFRLYVEPKRLWKRYLFTNPRFFV